MNVLCGRGSSLGHEAVFGAPFFRSGSPSLLLLASLFFFDIAYAPHHFFPESNCAFFQSLPLLLFSQPSLFDPRKASSIRDLLLKPMTFPPQGPLLPPFRAGNRVTPRFFPPRKPSAPFGQDREPTFDHEGEALFLAAHF